MIKTLILDFDGVILESVDAKSKAILALFPEASQQIRAKILELHKSHPGINRENRMRIFLTEGFGINPSQDRIKYLVDRFSLLVEKEMASCQEVRGVKKFLEATSHLSCYIASAAPENEVKTILSNKKLSHYFKNIFGSPYSKKEILNMIVSKKKCSNSSTLFIGDKISDYEAAKDIHINFLGRLTHSEPTKFPDHITTFDNFENLLRSSIMDCLLDCFSN